MNENVNNNKKTTVMLILLGIALVVGVVGITYAYFSTVVEDAGTSSMLMRGANLKITYNETKNITSDGVYPGWSDTKTFTIANNGDKQVSYNLHWSNVENTLVNKEYLVYRIEGSGDNAYNNSENTIFPDVSDVYIFENLTIDPEVIHTYTLTIEYLNDTSFDQQSDMGASFGASLEITTNDEITSTDTSSTTQ